MDTDQPLEASRPPHPTEAHVGAIDSPGGTAEQQAGSADRQLNVNDALTYLDSVKAQFAEQPEVYNKFLDIMKDFKSQFIDTPGVIERVSNLFHGHPALIQGFNTFLPAGYRIETTDNPDPNYITVTTPAGITTQATNAAFKYGPANTKPPPPAEKPAASSSQREPEGAVVAAETLFPARDFVQKVRTRYANHPDVYKQFLGFFTEVDLDVATAAYDKSSLGGMELLSVACLSAKRATGDVMHKIMNHLKDAPDLMRDFVQFIPDEQVQRDELARIGKVEEARKASEAKPKRGGDGHGHSSAATAVPQKRKRKPADREKEKEQAPAKGSANKQKAKVQPSSEAPSPALAQRPAAAPPSPLRGPPQPQQQTFYPHHQQTVALPPPIQAGPVQSTSAHHVNDEGHFFDRVKRVLDNRETYTEFLKLVNLFTQDVINTTRLVREARSFLGDGELMAQFKDILGWDVNKERMAALEESWTRPMGVLDRPSRNQLHTRYGSYRKLPAHEVNVQCSGRDEMCNSVLNDEYISQPVFASEDTGFIAHKKNVYEEALHRSEEERHEYDFHVEAINRTILVLEPLNNKIAQLSPEERASFKLKPNLGGVGKAIHQRVIKKIYGRDIGLEVWTAMQEVPATAIPVVLVRLKQKHEEWKRAQREWDKVWREVDARNYHKSLDHQAVTFKADDKKAITQKAFVTQIEAARDEQRVTRASLIDPLFARTKPRHQLEFVVEDPAVLQDTLKLTLSFLDRTQGQISLPDRRKIETFLRSFVPLFFMLDPVAFNAAFVPHHETVDEMDGEAAAEDVDMTGVNGSSSRSKNKKGGANNAGDLRKRLLKSEQAKLSRRTRAAASPTPSRFASPAPSEAMLVDGDSSLVRNDKSTGRRRGTFYTNTSFYVLLRLLEVLYSRLQLFKNLTRNMTDRSNDPNEPNPASIKSSFYAELGKIGDKDKDKLDNASHFYEFMLESCEKLFDNELEPHVFEEMMRFMFGVKHGYKMFTVDKVLGALIKQVQIILSDSKSQDLYELLKREREIPSPTTQDLINCRRNTERVLGPDENLFRIDWLPEPKTMTIQLIGKDDTTYDDSEVMTGRWQSYIESFVSHHYTAGVPTSSTIRRPFLLRTKIPAPSGAMPEILARGGLQIKVCVRTYRLFFVPHSEDIMVRISTREERAEARKLVDSRSQKRKKWLEDYAAKTLKDEPQSASAEVPSEPLAPTASTPTESYEAAPEVPPHNEVLDVPMELVQEQREQEPAATVHTVPQDDAVEVAAAAAVVGPALDPDSADGDVPMNEETPDLPPVNSSDAAPPRSPAPPVVVELAPELVAATQGETVPAAKPPSPPAALGPTPAQPAAAEPEPQASKETETSGPSASSPSLRAQATEAAHPPSPSPATTIAEAPASVETPAPAPPALPSPQAAPPPTSLPLAPPPAAEASTVAELPRPPSPSAPTPAPEPEPALGPAPPADSSAPASS
ncbi:hypothetical protein OH76DRAFT_1420354 [Lentinus brumalis]|uniref:Histone deacetylase interacting domain-containing protein n=1 Tax=Lentinus brumalis TaxID=2498619 RepID=A0A371D0P3_9APHY|nr:hypothetical protein OH76DRAFT_1420354 [Polyporus brumalis]